MAILIAAGRIRAVARCAVLVAGCAASAGQVVAQSTPTALEYRVKAAYLLNFTRYAAWPATAFAESGGALNVCVVGLDPFGDVLEETVRGRRTAGRLLQVLRPRRPADDVCHVAFFGTTAPATRDAWLAALQGEATLTVGEGGEFARAGGMIGFVIVDETVRFEINLEAVRAGGLQLSSRLVTLSTRLYPDREAR
jgi:hypothetical protein